jgi:di/tricarboxylate transporter
LYLLSGKYRGIPVLLNQGLHSRLHTLLTVGIFVLTLAGVLTRPRGISEAWFASIGALLLLLFGIVRPGDAWEVTRQSGDVLLFLLFLMALSALVDTSGFFDWAATLAARTARGNPRRLLIGVFLLGAAITRLGGDPCRPHRPRKSAPSADRCLPARRGDH